MLHTFNFVPYMQTINLVTTFDLVTLFGLTKSVSKSEVNCTHQGKNKFNFFEE